MTTQPYSEHLRARACTGKHRYPTRRTAARDASRYRRLGHGDLRPYDCAWCAFWHVGHLSQGTGLRQSQQRKDHQ